MKTSFYRFTDKGHDFFYNHLWTSPLLVRVLPNMLGNSLEQNDIELLNECLNVTWLKFPLFEGLGHEEEMQSLVSRGVLELFHEKERTYRATSMWWNYVKAILKDWRYYEISDRS